MTGQAQRLLGRLEAVHERGPGRWLARCPAHNDRSPSLSVRETNESTVLIHCFAGCEASEILGSIGLTLKDLFPGGVQSHHHPARPAYFAATDALVAIDQAALVVTVIANDFRKHRELDDETWGRLLDAVNRIGAARDWALPRKVKHEQ